MTKVTTNIRDKSDVKIVDASQYLGGDAAIDLREILDTLVAQNVLKIIVNLSAVEHINSRSIGTLIGTAKKTAHCRWSAQSLRSRRAYQAGL
jgi:anti-anti-sigma regulatory factor